MEGGGGGGGRHIPKMFGAKYFEEKGEGGGGVASRHNHLIIVNTKTWLSLGKSYCPSLDVMFGPKGSNYFDKRRGGEGC